jgi:hypothetical protein
MVDRRRDRGGNTSEPDLELIDLFVWIVEQVLHAPHAP